MSTVNTVGSSTSTLNSSSQTSSTTINYDNFLQLLITQMKNQDPTDPMDSAEYMAQLASFSQVEQSVAMNTKLDSLLTASALDNADAIIGRTITSYDGTVSGTVSSVKIYSDGAIATLSDGQEVVLGAGVTISD